MYTGEDRSTGAELVLRPPPDVLRAFATPPSARTVPLEGNIHDTFGVERPDGTRLVVQRINTTVFSDPNALIHNAEIVIRSLRDAGVPTARQIVSRAGDAIVSDRAGGAWRAIEWIDGAPPEARDEVPIVARAFGRYASALRTLPLHALVETIPRFHDLEHRVQTLNAAARADVAGRAAEVRGDLDRCRRLLARAGTLPELRVWKRVPRTIVHNDAKPANALVRADASVVVVDLDTTMAGSILSDVGELLRAGTRPLRERDGIAAPALYPEHVAAIVRAWVEGWDAPLHTAEEEALPLAGVMLTLENAVRFLTDHLAGDVYFRVVTPGQNLARHRSQLAHAQVQLDAFDDLRRAVRWALRSS